MRQLALIRYRLLTTIRSGTPIFAMAIAPPLIALLIETRSERQFLLGPDVRLTWNAGAAFLGWLLHTFIVAGAAQAFGARKPFSTDSTAPSSDLMDSAPIRARSRFFGEGAGILCATFMLHLCCLPVLASIAALSPLPTRLFLVLEAGILVLMIVGSTVAAWKIVAPASPSRTRGLRSGLLFYALVVSAFLASADREEFFGRIPGFMFSPSRRSWAALSGAIDNPVLLIAWLTLLVVSYLAYFFIDATRSTSRT